MNKYTKQINQETVNDIQIKDASYQSSQDVIIRLLETHSADINQDLIGSPIFDQFQKQVAEKKIAFEQSKTDMLAANFTQEEISQIKNWSLDYNTCTLTYQV